MAMLWWGWGHERACQGSGSGLRLGLGSFFPTSKIFVSISFHPKFSTILNNFCVQSKISPQNLLSMDAVCGICGKCEWESEWRWMIKKKKYRKEIKNNKNEGRWMVKPVSRRHTVVWRQKLLDDTCKQPSMIIMIIIKIKIIIIISSLQRKIY